MAKPRAKKSAAKARAPKAPTAKQRATLKKAHDEVKKAQKALDLKLKKHARAISAMFFGK